MSAKLILSWGDFDEFIQWASEEILARTGPFPRIIYAEPRGGLPIGVALSHRLGIPMTTTLFDLSEKMYYTRWGSEYILWVDDVIESGRTERQFLASLESPSLFGESRRIPLDLGPTMLTWVNKYRETVPDYNHISQRTIPKDTWVVFPWERPENADTERKEYDASRQ